MKETKNTHTHTHTFILIKDLLIALSAILSKLYGKTLNGRSRCEEKKKTSCMANFVKTIESKQQPYCRNGFYVVQSFII